MLIDLQNYFSSTDWLGEKTKCLSPGSSDWVGSLFSCSVVSNSLRAHGLQHTRLPGPLLAPGVCSNSCPLSQWCHPVISSSVSPFSSCPQSCPASGNFTSQLFPSGSQSIEASASASVLSMNIQGWFPLEVTSLISLLSKGLSRVFSSNTVWKHQFFSSLPSLLCSSYKCTWLLERP